MSTDETVDHRTAKFLQVREITGEDGTVSGLGFTVPSGEEIVVEGPTCSWDDFRTVLGRIGTDIGEWGGVPMPVTELRMVLEPRYPIPMQFSMLPPEEGEEPEAPRDDLLSLLRTPDARRAGYRIINGWYSWAKNAFITVIGLPSGKSMVYRRPGNGAFKLEFWLNTLHASGAWDLRAEVKAQRKLRRLIKPHAWEGYMMTGTFLERSPRTGIFYLFRRLRPTIALKGGKDGQMKMLACLCLHPIGFYERSWAGVMVPTDDVVAHLMLMRGCEDRFWSKATHWPTYEPAAGL